MFNDRSVCHWLKGIHVCELYLCTVGVSSGAFWTAQVTLHCMLFMIYDICIYYQHLYYLHHPYYYHHPITIIISSSSYHHHLADHIIITMIILTYLLYHTITSIPSHLITSYLQSKYFCESSRIYSRLADLSITG